MLYYEHKVNFTFYAPTGAAKEGEVVKNRLQELRKQNKVTQQELADALSVTRQTIISLESGRYNASLTLAHKAAQFFGMTIEELFIFEGEENL